MQPRHASQCCTASCIHAHLATRCEVHEQDATARGIHLLAPEQIGRARGEAEPAMDAIRDQRRIGSVVIIERARRRVTARMPV